MHKESFYQFILFVLLREGKSNIPFRIEAMLLGKQYASRHYFKKLFKGCDMPSFMNLKVQFENEWPQYFFDLKISDIEKDKNGLMNGSLLI